MLKPTARVAVALTRIKNDVDMMAFLTAERGETLEQIASQRDDIALRQLQGKAQFLFELLALVERSPELANKLST